MFIGNVLSICTSIWGVLTFESGGLFGDVLAVIGSSSLGNKLHHFFRDTVPAPPRPSFLILDEFSTIGWLVVHVFFHTPN